MSIQTVNFIMGIIMFVFFVAITIIGVINTKMLIGNIRLNKRIDKFNKENPEVKLSKFTNKLAIVNTFWCIIWAAYDLYFAFHYFILVIWK